jgi:hypothetical protein
LIRSIKELKISLRSIILDIIFIAIYSYDSIICVAGGFDIGSVKDKDVFEKY